ncbi:hypothetical protein AB5N19_11819 [Seiridium cardinale]
MPQFAFVATDDSARVRPSERLVIRRHCMRQKNKQPGSRRSKREAAREAAEFLRRSEVHDRESSSGLGLIPAKDQFASRPYLTASEGRRQGSDPANLAPPPPSDWALFSFPEELDVSSQKLMHQYYLRNPIRDILYPFKYFGVLVDFREDPLWCFRTLCSEDLYFHVIRLLTSASSDLISQQPLSTTTHRYLRRIIPVLNNRISDANAFENDVILYVVSVLALIAILFGDYNTARTHAIGLAEIIRLRGGFGTVDYNPVVQFSIDRLNFSSLLVTKLWTPLYDSSIWADLIFPDNITSGHHSEDIICIDDLVEPDLAAIFHKLQRTTILLNKHYYEKTPVDGLFIRQCLGSVHSSLIDFEDRLEDALSETLQLGMMAFLATTFRLPGSYEQHYSKALTKQLQISYVATKASTPDLQDAIDIWLILIFLISMTDLDELYAQESRNTMAERWLSWSETRRRLKQVLWIDSFHDEVGKRAFQSFLTRNKSMPHHNHRAGII